MKVLVIGSGGRDHAIAWSFTRSSRVKQVYVAHGNGGIARTATCVNAKTVEEMAAFAESEKIDLTFVGPEKPLSSGIVDEFERRGLPIIGPSQRASRLESSKCDTKLMLQELGIPVPEFAVFSDPDDARSYVRQVGYPVVVKPADIGSSVGVCIAHDRQEFEEAVATVRRYSERVLVERYVKGLKEINISVLGDAEGLKLSVCEEPITASEFLTYQDKYAGGGSASGSKVASADGPSASTAAASSTSGAAGTSSAGMQSAKRRIPAELPEEVRTTIEAYARKAFETLDCSGVTRIDFILEPVDPNGRPEDFQCKQIYINEFNTIPGSLSFYLWEATGKPFPELLDDLVELGLRKKRRRSKLTFTHDINILATGSFGVKK